MGLTLLKLFILCNFKFHNNLAEYSPQLLFIKVEIIQVLYPLIFI